MKEEALRGCSGSIREGIAVMGSVLSFAPRDVANIRKPAMAAGATASIVIFPGVRYERSEGHIDAGQATVEKKSDKPTH